MNREALPLIVGIAVPIIAVALIISYVLGIDYLAVFRAVSPIYFIVLIPFILGAFAAGMWLRKSRD